MGARGPVPKRSSERRRQNKESRADTVQAAGAVPVPALPKSAHSIARRWYRSLRMSGQAQYYEPSDWAAALLVAEQMGRLLEAGSAVGGPAFTALWSAMNDLMTTEGARRRARIEVERGAVQEEAPPGVSAIEEYRLRMQP
jgi:hypothetical protein